MDDEFYMGMFPVDIRSHFNVDMTFTISYDVVYLQGYNVSHRDTCFL